MRILILLFSVFFVTQSALAQQSSKSKSKDRFREKDQPGNLIRVLNAKEINSANTDYSPVIYQNGLVFVSSRKSVGPRDPKTNETYSKLYFSAFDPNGEPSTPARFAVEINSYLNEGPVTFSRDYKTLFFTRNNMHKGVQKADDSGKKVHLKIYEARRGAKEWIEKGELPFNSNNYSCLHPSLNAAGDRLYFASDMPGGQGGFDIYFSEKIDNEWQAPVNAGPEVNTDQNEVFPFIHPTGTLFFSSNGHNTIGGLDLFYTEVNDKGETEIVNMGEPFNSASDERGIVMIDEGTRGFFTSNRKNSYGKDDIFSFTIEKGIQGMPKPEARPVEIMVFDAKTDEALQGAEIRILRPSQEGFVGNDQNSYDLSFEPLQSDPNALTMKLKRKGANKLGPPDLTTNLQGQANTDFFLYRSYFIVVSLEGYGTRELFYEVNPDTEGPIEIGLSEAPACHQASGIVSTEQTNIRIAFANLRFIHKISGHSVAVNTDMNGQYDVCLPYAGDYLVQVEHEGFKNENLTVKIADVSSMAFNEVKMRTEAEGGAAEAEQPLAGPLREGRVIVLDNIKYDNNQATLNQRAIRSLDALYDLLQRYPGMEIDITAHSDTRGDAEANLQLTEERAGNAKKYLVYRGISEKRIKTIGKGETEPRNHCTDGVPCSEAEHQENIRFEVKVKKIGA